MNSDKHSKVIHKILSADSDVRAATARHQQQFPYDRGEEAQVARREFCNFLALTSTALFLGAVGFAAKAGLEARSEQAVAPAKVPNAGTLAIGFALNFAYPTEKDSAILVRVSEDEYRAYGQKCTHLACPVYFERERGRLECPCHEGAFDIKTGNVLYGPPPRPLDRIEIERRDDGEVWAISRKPGETGNAI